MFSTKVRTTLTAAALCGLAFGGIVNSTTSAAAPISGPGSVVQSTLFGIHAVNADPKIPAGTMRMALLPSWRSVQPARGVYNWAKFDGIVKLYESWGYRDILYSFGSTPAWAAGTPVPGFVGKVEAEGPGSTAPPTGTTYADFVRAVATRYRGRIKTYETWNEPTSAQFFRGTPAQMANMTAAAYTAVHKADPNAKVTTGSVQTHSAVYTSFGLPYFRALAAKGWPVDVVAGHFYPSAGRGMDGRYDQLVMMRSDLTALGLPKDRQLFDTEVNLAPGSPQATPEQGAAAVARNYLDTLRAGYTRSYWFLATVPF